MRKLMLALLLTLYIPTVAPAALSDPPAAQIQVPVSAKWNRTAKLRFKGSDEVRDLGENRNNPFPSKEACVAGLEEDTHNIYVYLMIRGVNIENVDVQVSCSPAGNEI